MCSTTQQNNEQQGALIHLVEAATALTQLVDGPGVQQKQSVLPTQSNVMPIIQSHAVSVSDDEESQQPPLAAKQHHLPVFQPSPLSFHMTVLPELSPREIFPQRLMSVLSNHSVSDIISWLPHGRSFVILRPDVFASRIMPVYFGPETGKPAPPSSTFKYPSFTRKLNRWGFRQISRGPDAGAFHHDLFRRDQPDLCRKMVCQKSRRPKSTRGNKASAPPSPMAAPQTATTAEVVLPPKKRKLSVSPTRPEPVNLSLALSRTVSACSSVSSVSSDSPSASSVPNETFEANKNSASQQVGVTACNSQFNSIKPAMFQMPSVPAMHAAQSVLTVQQTTQLSPLAPRPPRRTSMTQRIPYSEGGNINILPNRSELLKNGQANAESAKSMLYKAYLQALSS